MSPRDFLRSLIGGLRGNRLRTGLTMFGIIWGVAFSLILGGLSDSLRDAFIHEMERFGMYEVFLWPGRVNDPIGGYRAGRDLRFDDQTLAALRAHSPSLSRLSPQIWVGFAEVKAGSRVRSFPVIGVDPPVHEIRRFHPARGRELNDADQTAARKVCFLGDNARHRLFGEADPIGHSVRINNRPFIVVGVAEPKGDSLFRQGWQDDDLVLIPSTTAQRVFVGDPHYPMVILQAVSREASYTLVNEVKRVLGALHRFPPADDDALSVFNTVDNVMKVIAIQRGSAVFGAVVNVTTLIVGGIGLMNILLVTVNERTRELALRRALGATRRNLMMQVLGESLAITLIAGTLGVLLAVAVRVGVSLLPLPPLFRPPDLPLSRVAVAFLFMVIVGVLAGIVPARRAAVLDPAEALRVE